MAILNGFNANDVEPTSPYEPLPAGQYPVAITESVMKPTKRGDGSYLEIELTVLDGDYQGRKVWDRLNLNNPNEMAQRIAQGTLSAICRAVGVMQPNDSAELHNLPMLARITCRKRDDTGEITNEVKGYEARVGHAGHSAPAPVRDAAPPWKRGKEGTL